MIDYKKPYEKEVVTVKSNFKSNFKFEEIIKVFDKYLFGAMPVIDGDRKLIGIVSRIDILKVFVPDYFDMLNGLVFKLQLMKMLTS